MYIAGLNVKERITLYDSVLIFKLATLAEKESTKSVKGLVAKFKKKKIVMNITKQLLSVMVIGKVKSKDIFKLNELLKYYGLLNNNNLDENKKKPEDQLNESAAWFASELNKSPIEVLKEFSDFDILPMYKNILYKKIQNYLLIAYAHNDPKALQGEIKKFQDSIKQAESNIKSMPESDLKAIENYTPIGGMDYPMPANVLKKVGQGGSVHTTIKGPQ